MNHPRYLVFVGLHDPGSQSPVVGWHSLLGRSDDYEEAKAGALEGVHAEIHEFKPELRKHIRAWWQVVDTHTDSVIAEGVSP